MQKFDDARLRRAPDPPDLPRLGGGSAALGSSVQPVGTPDLISVLVDLLREGERAEDSSSHRATSGDQAMGTYLSLKVDLHSVGEYISGYVYSIPVRARHGEGKANVASRALQNVCLVRAFRGLIALLDKLEPSALERAARVPHDLDTLCSLMLAPGALAGTSNPLAAAMVRGAAAKRELLQQEGGTIETAQMAELLGISAQAIGKQRDRKQLLGLPVGRRYVFPLFQVDDHQVLQGLPRVLAAFAEDVSPWEVANFMLTGDRRLAGRRPVDVLREGDVEAVVRAAQGFGEHGG